MADLYSTDSESVKSEHSEVLGTIKLLVFSFTIVLPLMSALMWTVIQIGRVR